MPKLSLNASKKTKHTPAGEIPVDWGWAGCFANGVGDGLGNSANRIGGNSDDSAIGIGDGSGNSMDRIGGHSGHSVDRIEGRVGTRASVAFALSALRYVPMAIQAILRDARPTHVNNP